MEGENFAESKILIGFCFCFLAGVWLATADLVVAGVNFLLPGLFVSLAIVSPFFLPARIQKIFLASVIFSSAIFWTATWLGDNIGQLPTGEFQGSVRLIDEPVSDLHQQKVRVESADGLRLILYLPLFPQYHYGDQLLIHCQIQPADPGYLWSQRVFFQCRWPQVVEVGRQQRVSFLFSRLYQLRFWLLNRIQQLWPEPDASLLSGLLVGYTGGLGEEEKYFQQTGTAHILAVSGYNVTLVVNAVLLALRRIPLPQIRKTIGMLVVLGFILLTGASASVVRAGLMATANLFFAGDNRAYVFLFSVAVLMVGYCPFSLRYDLGFQLSFLATFGLLFLTNFWERWCRFLPNYFQLRTNLSATMSAWLFTLPLTLKSFSQLTVIAPVANLALLWAIPLAMVSGLAAVLSSVLSFSLAKLLAVFPYALLRYLVSAATLFSFLGEKVNKEVFLSGYLAGGFYLFFFFYWWKKYA
ncbi:MAG TPA: ComEC/Rec2 family competence protein [Patescibacteria group bacterium]|nr:ComEC/Rec2 family competence protein [Patescibacteria group bacterium]